MLFLANAVYGQTEDVTYEYKKGKKYIVHIVEAGNTLWGLHSTYHVSVDEIIAANPGIEKGLNAGAKVLIPAGNAEAGSMDGTMVKGHVVQKGETLYGIAKKNNVTVDDISKLNPDAVKNLSPGTVLRIPVSGEQPTVVAETKEPAKVTTKPSVTFSDSTIIYEVKQGETLYSISKRFMVDANDLQTLNKLKSNKLKPGDQLTIPLKKENIKQVPIREVEPVKEVRKVDTDLLFKPKDEYHIAMILPFGLDGGAGSSGSLKQVATEYYMGVQVALDSLEKEGFKAVVHIYDVTSDTSDIKAILKKPEMKQMDLVFGPLLPDGADVAGDWCRKNQIRLVCPASVNMSVLKSNPFVYAAVTSDVTLHRLQAEYILKTHPKDQVVLVNVGSSRDKDIYDAFRNRFIELSKTSGNVKLNEIGMDNLAAFIRKGGNTVIVVPTRDKGSAQKFVNALLKIGDKAGSGTITVYGTKDWAGIDEIRGVTKNTYNITWLTGSDLNYALENTKKVLRRYRIDYHSDMTKYGAQGFDVTYYFIKSLLMGENPGAGIMNDFNMEAVSEGNGLESRHAYILKNENFELIREAEIND